MPSEGNSTPKWHQSHLLGPIPHGPLYLQYREYSPATAVVYDLPLRNRILNLSILVAAGTTIVIPVSCVEAGRWHHSSCEFYSAPRTQYAEGRSKRMAQVSESMKSSEKRRSNQGAVWSDINLKFAKLGASSPTSAMSDIFEQQSSHIENYVRSFTPVEGQTGAVFSIDGKIVGLELFDSSATLRKLLPKLLRSYALDALGQSMSRRGDRTEDASAGEPETEAFLNRISQAEEQVFAAVGEGRDIRFEGQGLTGALAIDDRVIRERIVALRTNIR